MSNSNNNIPKVGQRFRLKNPAERGNCIWVDAGECGTITQVDDEHSFYGKLDKHFESLDEWDNQLQWGTYNPDIPAETAIGQFNYEAEIIPSSIR